MSTAWRIAAVAVHETEGERARLEAVLCERGLELGRVEFERAQCLS